MIEIMEMPQLWTKFTVTHGDGDSENKGENECRSNVDGEKTLTCSAV